MQNLKEFAAHIASKKDVKRAYKPRGLYSDKYLNGKVVVVGGGASYHGAPVLAATAASNTLAALRVGAGYAITCVPKSIELAVRKTSPNLVVRALTGQYLNSRDLEILKTVTKRASSIVIGPGLGRSSETLNTIRSEFLKITEVNNAEQQGKGGKHRQDVRRQLRAGYREECENDGRP